jgi:WD40 repeat protein
LMCATFDEEGWCYTGGDNGLVQVWNAECQVVKTVKAHASQVTAIVTDGAKLITGSKD